MLSLAFKIPKRSSPYCFHRGKLFVSLSYIFIHELTTSETVKNKDEERKKSFSTFCGLFSIILSISRSIKWKTECSYCHLSYFFIVFCYLHVKRQKSINETSKED